jgi:hypothetical protein
MSISSVCWTGTQVLSLHNRLITVVLSPPLALLPAICLCTGVNIMHATDVRGPSKGGKRV